MSAQPDDAWLIALGAEVSDGKTVDWALADRSATDEEARTIVRNLKRLEKVIQGHRTAGGEEPPEQPDSGEVSTGHWHHLVLFESVGSGAFGTVYRAWDTKVDREVALKLLPTGMHATRSPLGEARHLARVRHPNIVTVYGAEQDVDQVGIWMEFIEGETLAHMIRERGPMSAREVVGIGVDLCRALSALQGASLLHRDIKPHNVMREIGGRIVLMDFSGAWASDRGEMPATVSGTPSYMAPELFEERPASVASDIYSLGVLLFYLLSGRLPFEGASIADLRQAHATGARTRLRDLRPELPEAVVQVVERASAAAARDRYQTAGELEHALIGTSGLQASALGMAGARQTRAWVTWTSVGIAALALTALAFEGSLRRPAAADRPLVRFTISPPDNTWSWPRVSPDGRMVVYGSTVEGHDTLWLRRLEDDVGRPIPHTSARESPFWSPDSRWLAFFEDGKLKKVAIAGGGQPQTLADALLPRGGDWNRANVLLFGTEAGLFRIGADGTGLAAVTTLDPARGEYSHGWPEFLPDGRRFLFVVRSTQPQHAGLYLGQLDSPVRTRVMPVLSRAVYSAAGYLLFAQDSSLLAQRFDERTGTLSGVPELIAAPIKHHPSSDGAFDVADGVLIYRLSEGLPMTRLMLFDRSGMSIKAISPIASYRHPRLSPDGQRVVVERLESITANPDLWLYDHVRQMASRFTTSEAPDIAPTWSPDGRQIAFSSKRGGRYDVYVKTVDEVTPEKLLWSTDGDKIIEDWSPDGRWLVGSIPRSGLWQAPVGGTSAPEQLRATSRSERWLVEFSPDGRWMAYTSFESDGPEVYVAPLGRSDARWQVSAGGGADPHWREDGRELFYMTLDGQIASVEVSPTDSAWQLGRSSTLFSVRVPDPGGTSDFDVSRDGQTFVVNTLLGYPTVPPVQVVLNWTNLLKR